MALKSCVVEWSSEHAAYRILLEDELIGAAVIREVPFLRCAAAAGEMSATELDELDSFFGGIARAIAVRDYLQEIGEDPDAPTLA